MGIVSDIEGIVTGLYPDATFMLSSYFNANVESFRLTSDELPFIVLNNEMFANVEIKKNNNIGKTYKISIMFLDLDRLDNDDVGTNTIQEAMEIIADRVLVNIYQLQNVRMANNSNQRARIDKKFHIFNTNLSGVELNLDVNYNTVVNFCKT